jgi:hypothetical protein
MLIGISGYVHDGETGAPLGSAGAGKDAVAKFLVEAGFTVIAFADPLKRIVREVYDFTEEQLWGPSALRDVPDKRYLTGYAELGHMLTEEALKEYPDGRVPQYLTPRAPLKTLGTEWGRTLYDNTWVAYLLRTADQFMSGGYRYDQRYGLVTSAVPRPVGVAVPDVRFINEVKAIRAKGGKVVRVKRLGVPHPDVALKDAPHVSETQLLDLPDDFFDAILPNYAGLDLLGLYTRRMLDVFRGLILPYDDAQADVPPFKRTR